MLTLYNKMNINYEKLYKNHEYLLEKSKKFYNKLNKADRGLLNEYKMGPVINSYLYKNDNLYNLPIERLLEYYFKYKVNENFVNCNNIIDVINNKIKETQTRQMDDMYGKISKMDGIFSKAIKSGKKLSIYRFQPFENKENKFIGFTSFSLIPIPYFCQQDECVLYHTIIDDKYKFIYLEANHNDKTLPTEIKEIAAFSYEYELLYPRGMQYKIISKNKIKVENPDYARNKTSKYKYITVIQIKFTGKETDAVEKIKPHGVWINY